MTLKIKQKIMFVVMNGLFYVALYFGIFEETPGAANIAVFYAWFTFIAWLFTYFAVTCKNEDLKRKLSDLERAFPSWVIVGVDIIAVLVMIWDGWIITSTAYILGMFAEYSVVMTLKEKRKKE